MKPYWNKRGRILGLALAFLACAAGAMDVDLPLRNAAWLAPGSDTIVALTRAPAECFRAPVDAARASAAEAGRIVFRSPLLLGGPAAKSGLSCQTCHINGHANPDFFSEGLSAAPGTADVTSHLFSKTRGDGVFNPKKIPSLLDIPRTRRAGEADRIPGLEPFVHGVIVDEFQGAEPAPPVFEALLAYVSALDRSACPEQGIIPIRLANDLDLMRSGATALHTAAIRGDAALADFLLVSLRSLLGEIHERFERPGLDEPRAILRSLSRDLGDLRGTASMVPALSAWRTQLEAAESVLQRFESRSLYNPAVIRKVLSKAEAPQSAGGITSDP